MKINDTFLKILLIVFLSGCALLALSISIDYTSCKQKANVYGLSYLYKFPSGCLIGVRK